MMDYFWSNGISTLVHADARDLPLPGGSVHCVVTSPPYFGLREYGVEDAIGNEDTIADHIENLRVVFREIRRVLRDDGTVWLNYGDSYVSHQMDEGYNGEPNLTRKGRRSSNQSGQLNKAAASGLRSKNLIGMPWRIAFALQDDGWILRSAIVWHKLNPMPESVKDRPSSTYENIFLFSKQDRYFYDGEAVRRVESGGANARNVWTFATQSRTDLHFATFPDELPRRCILAGTSAKGACSECGKQWERVIEKPEMPHDIDPITKYGENSNGERIRRMIQSRRARGISDTDGWSAKTVGWQPTCGCEAEVVPATVFDPFVGSGTSCAVAQALGRRSVGTDLNHEYLGIAMKRIEGVSMPMVMTT